MANKSPFSKILSAAHVPSFLLIIGYVCYWIELYFIKKAGGICSPLAYVLFGFIFFGAVLSKWRPVVDVFYQKYNAWKAYGIMERFIYLGSLLLVCGILVIVIKALLLPPHLSQEFDSLNYHITLPRQHLISHSFKHISWSSADLFPLPVQFALAPYWLVGEMPNKFIQLFFVIGLAIMSSRLLQRLGGVSLGAKAALLFAIFGLHSLGIQMPVVMLDLVFCYLFLAAIDSAWEGNYILCGIETAFLFWAKPFFPMLWLAVLGIIVCSGLILKKTGVIKKITYSFTPNPSWKFEKKYFLKLILSFFCASLFIASPFLIKSSYYSGTPLYPFFPGIINSSHIKEGSSYWKSMVITARNLRDTKDGYGSGRSLLNFIKHIWIISVPEKDVNNRFDYPLGLPYLIFLGPFGYLLIKSFKNRKFAVFPYFVVVYWLIWWFGSQQARFLYPPLIMIFITVCSLVEKPSKIFMTAIMFSLIFNFVSIYKANYKDFALPVDRILRERDRQILTMNKEYAKNGKTSPVALDYYDVAYASFSVKVTKADYCWVMASDK